MVVKMYAFRCCCHMGKGQRAMVFLYFGHMSSFRCFAILNDVFYHFFGEINLFLMLYIILECFLVLDMRACDVVCVCVCVC